MKQAEKLDLLVRRLIWRQVAPEEVPCPSRCSCRKRSAARVHRPADAIHRPSNLKRMKEVYQHLPVKVLPMQLCSDDITASRFLTLMVANSNK